MDNAYSTHIHGSVPLFVCLFVSLMTPRLLEHSLRDNARFAFEFLRALFDLVTAAAAWCSIITLTSSVNTFSGPQTALSSLTPERFYLQLKTNLMPAVNTRYIPAISPLLTLGQSGIKIRVNPLLIRRLLIEIFWGNVQFSCVAVETEYPKRECFYN
jgi:hypothetical protein